MYRLVLYLLILLVVVASSLSAIGLLSHNGFYILASATYLSFICWITNKILAKILKVKTNPESALISGLILSLIFGPVFSLSNLIPLTAIGVFGMTSKYLIVLRGRHIFNPAAFGATASAVILGQGASWWVGDLPMAPFILISGFLILKKIRKFEMVAAFLASMTVLMVVNSILGHEPFDLFVRLRSQATFLLVSPLTFFALVMLVEPLTSPFRKSYQVMYAILIALLFYFLGSVIPYSLEASLLIGNIFAYITNSSFRQVLILRKKEKLSTDVIGFWFEPWKKFEFKPGQFLEWTLSHPRQDNRGIRRFFTIASSPSENLVLLATKFYEKPSTFKQVLAKMEPRDEIIVSNLGGEFTLPNNLGTKLVFIAGGIGITPFRAITKWILDNKEPRDIILFFSNKTQENIVFEDIFKKAEQFGLKTVYINTNRDGHIDEKLINGKVPDFRDRTFYISGPEPMVKAFNEMLGKMGIKKSQVKKDYFPGYTETYTTER
ncbi:MAG: Oxidoreductase FAD/NAD(P)-binding domain protein [Candidatus Levybacteria bacterium GW2011_GWB1_37_8]|nr:MAG: Oxidoreductase FAD/NAD(P)-binding domain protein [Candidatus Levybacteria bacterium GW2011_GWB1_37_8]